MRTKAILFLLMFMVLGASTLLGAERPHIGIMLDPQPLPALLVKHLRLTDGEGTRISNVVVGGAGDKANLQRDDIVLALDGVKVDGAEKLIEELKRHEVGQEARLEIIRLGERKTVELTLGTATDEIKWKYPLEPNVELQWQPGRVFILQPGQNKWVQMPFHQLMASPEIQMKEGGVDVRKFFAPRHSFQYSEDGREYQIIIEGDPQDDNAVITVRIGDEEHTASVKDIDNLPEEYRKSAVDALEKARKGRGSGSFSVQIGPGGTGLSDNPTIPDSPQPRVRPDSERLDRIEKRLQQLQKRLENLENQQGVRENTLKDEPNESSNATKAGVVIEKWKRT